MIVGMDRALRSLTRRQLQILAGVTIAALVLLWSFLFLAALSSVPLLAGDHLFFSPVIEQMRLNGTLTQPYVEHAAGTKFNWHSWLYPTIMAWLPGTDDYFTIGIAFLSMVILAMIIVSALLLREGLSPVGIMLLPVMLAVLLFQMPRFELLAAIPLSLAIPLLFTSNPPGKLRHGALASLLALVCLIQPTLGFLCCIGITIALVLWSRSFLRFLATTAMYAAIVLVIVAGATELNPQLTFTEWVGALVVQARYLSGRSESGYIVYDLLDPQLFFKFVYFLPIPLFGWRLWQLSRTSAYAGQRLMLGALFALAAFAIWFISIRLPGAAYNLVGLAPLIWFGVYRLSLTDWKGRPLVLGIVIIAFVGAVSTLTYRAMIVAATLQDGLSAATFRDEIATLDRSPVSIGVNMAMLPYVDQILEHAQVTPWPRDDLGQAHPEMPWIYAPPRLVIVEQADSGALQPPPETGYRLVRNRFTATPPRLFGITIARTRKDFGYAIYCRIDWCRNLHLTG